MSHRILLVSHDAGLRQSRYALLTKFGYAVDTAQSAESAMDAVSVYAFDLVVVGRNSLSDRVAVDQQLRIKYPLLLILKIVDPVDRGDSYASRMTDSSPENVITVVKEMLNK